jgi:phenylalanyl-tRNA synthetase beta chain
MVGLGYQEVLTYTMTNQDNLFSKMNIEPTSLVEIANPKVVTMTCLRNWLLPGLMEFLSNNQSVEFPQKVFELGKVMLLDETRETKTRDENWMAAVTSHANASFSEIKASLNSLFMNLGLNWSLEATSHPSFIEGRVGTILVDGEEVGSFGELNPEVLRAWKLENPTSAFEINVQKVFAAKTRKI